MLQSLFPRHLKGIIRTQDIMKTEDIIYYVSERQMIPEIQFICILARDWHNLLVRKESCFSAMLLGVIHLDTAYVTHMFPWSVLFAVF